MWDYDLTLDNQTLPVFLRVGLINYSLEQAEEICMFGLSCAFISLFIFALVWLHGSWILHPHPAAHILLNEMLYFSVKIGLIQDSLRYENTLSSWRGLNKAKWHLPFKSKCFEIYLFFLPLKYKFYGTDHLLLNLKLNGEFWIQGSVVFVPLIPGSFFLDH